mmetsp:Transcript_26993/g.23829  ORF Transcript_26993/g.23829 Transcript_26993/m.23829 type:complete len:103 (-) Transcript_26993:756-1064(-)
MNQVKFINKFIRQIKKWKINITQIERHIDNELAKNGEEALQKISGIMTTNVLNSQNNSQNTFYSKLTLKSETENFTKQLIRNYTKEFEHIKEVKTEAKETLK